MEYRDDVYELQTWLRRIFRGRDDVALIIPSGVFTDETAEYVRLFQSEHGMTPTGVVDYETWCAVKDAYLDLEQNECASVSPFPSPDCVICKGENCDTVMICQIMLAALSVAYDRFYDVQINGSLDDATARSIAEFQAINRIPETGEIDMLTWNALARNYNVFANNRSYTG